MNATDRFDRVANGDPLRIPAARANAWSDAARKVLVGEQDLTVPGVAPAAAAVLVCTVRNDTGGDLAERSVLRVSGTVTDPAATPFEFQAAPVFTGAAPGAGTDRFVVLLEPVKNGKYGRAAHAGLVVAEVNVVDANDTFAGPTAGVTARLTTAADGPAAVLWKESGTGNKKAAVLLPDYRSYVPLPTLCQVSNPNNVAASYPWGSTLPGNMGYMTFEANAYQLDTAAGTFSASTACYLTVMCAVNGQAANTGGGYELPNNAAGAVVYPYLISGEVYEAVRCGSMTSGGVTRPHYLHISSRYATMTTTGKYSTSWTDGGGVTRTLSLKQNAGTLDRSNPGFA